MTTLKRPTLDELEEAIARAVELQRERDEGADFIIHDKHHVIALAGEVQGLLRLLQQLATDPADDPADDQEDAG